jgi:hypothetical protein
MKNDMNTPVEHPVSDLERIERTYTTGSQVYSPNGRDPLPAGPQDRRDLALASSECRSL